MEFRITQVGYLNSTCLTGMAYSDFTIDRVRNELDITLDFSASLFDDVSPVVASNWLVDTLALMAPMAMANTERFQRR